MGKQEMQQSSELEARHSLDPFSSFRSSVWTYEPLYMSSKTTATSVKMAALSAEDYISQDGCLNSQDDHHTAAKSAPKIKVHWIPRAPLQLNSKQNKLIVKL